MAAARSGPLAGVRVVEMAGVGPVPFTGMLLADMGADVICVDRMAHGPKGTGLYSLETDLLYRGVRSVSLDMKAPEAAEVVLDLAAEADVFLEGFRPGVAERLGIGPDACLARNPKLVYGRMTGWGQEGPYSQMAAYDLNYISLTGTLGAMGPQDGPPNPPLNLIGDYGGGGMLLSFGVVAALFEARGSGKGQVIDAAMIDGVALLSTVLYTARRQGEWSDERGANLLDGGAPFYQVYETSDGRFVSVAAIAPKFYEQLVDGVGLAAEDLPEQWAKDQWPAMRSRFAEKFRTRTRDEWCAVFEGTDVCFAPVLSPAEAAQHPHIRARETLIEIAGGVQPHPAPRFSRTPGAITSPPPSLGQHTEEVLTEWGLAPERVEALRAGGVIP